MVGSTRRVPSLVLAVLVATGCASTNVDRAKDLSSAGVRYARATSAVVEIAIDASIDAQSAAEVIAVPRPDALQSPKERRAELEKLDRLSVASTVYYTKLRGSIGTVEAYFLALQALAEGSQEEATQAAVATLADRVNSLNATLEKGGGTSPPPVLTDAQKKALSGLSGVVAKQIHGAIVGRALERDAEVIGKAILLQQLVLRSAESDIAAKIMTDNDQFYLRNILGPYQKGTIDQVWIENRRTYIKVKALGQTLEAVKSAQAASAQMWAAWKKILSGEYSVAELAATLRETDELLAAVAALKAAERPRAPQ